jgi:hypothetical protein
MLTRPTSNLIIKWVCFLAVLGVAALQALVPQAINYQGRVIVGSTNFDGTGRFKFALVDAGGTTTFWSNDGSSVAGSEPVAAVSLPVGNGLYSVLLGDAALPNMQPVPPAVFNHAGVYLRVWFDDGIHGSQRLAPDQRLASVGYAMVAGSVPDGAITRGSLAPEQVVTGLNGIKDEVTLVAGSNVTIVPAGNQLTISATGGSAAGIDPGISAMFAGRAALRVSTDIPAVTFSSFGSGNPIGGGVTYPFNTTSVMRLGCYPVTVSSAGASFQQNRCNGQSGDNAQPWAVEFDTKASDIVLLFRAGAASARIWCWVDGCPISELAPDQTAGVTAGNPVWYRLRFATAERRRLRLYLVACDFGGITVPAGHTIVANPKAEVRRCVFIGDSWGGESGTSKFPFVVPHLIGRMLNWEMAHCSIGGSGYLAGTPFSDATRVAGRNAILPHYAIISGSINDSSFAPAAIQAAASAYYANCAADLPANCKLFVVGPQPVPSGASPSAALLANRDAVRTAALAAPNVLAFIDPIEGRWIFGSGTVASASVMSDGNASHLLAPDGIHLSAAGSFAYASRIAQDILRALERANLWRQGAGANEVVPTAPLP